MQVLDDINMSGNRVTNIGDPVGDTDAINKRYMDMVKQGLNPKDAVKAATTATISLSGLQTVDTVVLADGDRVLVKDQTNAVENGIYVAHPAAWERAEDANADADMKPGTYVFADSGAQNIFGGFIMTNVDPVVLGVTEIRFTRFSAAGQITAGTGMTKNGQTLDVNGTPGRIVANIDSIDIDPDYVGQTSITTLGDIGTGTWNAATIAVTRGGTGATDPAGAKLNLGFLTPPDLTALNEAVADYSTAASNLDVPSSIYKTVDYNRYPDNTLYMRTSLSNPDVNGNFQSLTIDYYNAAGDTVIATHTWTLTYDAQHSVVTKVRTT